jgi:hypothetical protein
MRTITTTITDALYEEAQSRAAQENMSLDEFVALAVSKMLSARQAEDYLRERARRGDEQKFRDVLSKVPDVEPDERDRL